jgi:hypothetical protein
MSIAGIVNRHHGGWQNPFGGESWGHAQRNEHRAENWASAQNGGTAGPAPLPDDGRPKVDLSDFTKIDTVQKACLLPALNSVVMSALYGSMTPGSALVSAALNMYFNGVTGASLNYSANPSANVLLQGQGQIGNAAFNETWTAQKDGSIQIEGTIGDSKELLTIKSDNRFWHLDGQVGSVEVHQRGFVVLGPADRDDRYVLDGTLNDSPYHSSLYLRSPELVSYGYLETSGNSMRLLGSPPMQDGSVGVSGQGFVGGTYVALNGTLNVPGPPPAPPTTPGQPAGGDTPNNGERENAASHSNPGEAPARS